LYLKGIELRGFKSFADGAHLEFGRGINAIVGPNGSGKTNVADAIRWALGEQSVRQLRAERLNDVIFSGSSARRRVGMAEVRLTFDNEDGVLNVDYPEVTVCRRAYRSGASEFTLNGVPCRLRDIQELLAGTGVGRGSASMMDQVQMQALIAPRSDERRAVIEECAGISRYRARKDEALRRLDETEARLVRVNDLASEVASNLEPLRREAERAARFESYSAELRDLELSRAYRRWRSLAASVRGRRTRVERLRTERERAARRLEHKEKEVLRLRRGLRELLALASAVEQECARLDRKAGDLSRNVKGLEERLSDLDRSEVAARAELRSARGALARLRAEAAAEERLCGRARDELASNRARLEEVVAASDALAGSARAGERGLERLETELDRVREEAARLSGASSEAAARRQAGERRLREVEAGLETVEKRLDRESARRDVVGSRAEALDRGLGRGASTADALEERGRELDREARRLGEQAGRLEDRERRLVALAREIERRLRSNGRSSRTGQRLARVVDVLQAARGYERAVEAALSAAADWYLTRSRGEALGEVLAAAKDGGQRRTFVPLDFEGAEPLSQAEMKFLVQAGATGALLDAVTCDEKHRRIVSGLLGRFVVAPDVRAAARCAGTVAGAWAVTPHGEVAHPGGPLTGGRARAGGLLLQRRLHSLEERLESTRSRLVEVRSALESTRERRDAMTARAARVRRKLESAYARRAAMGREIESISETLSRLRSERDRLQREREAVRAEVESYAAKFREARREMERCSRRRGRVERTIRRLRERVNAGRDRRVELSSEIAEVRARIASLEEEVRRGRERVSGLEDRREELSGAVRDYERLLAEVDRDRSTVRRGLDRLREARSRVTSDLKRRSARARRLREAGARLERRAGGVEEEAAAIRAELSGLDESLKRAELELARLEVEERSVRGEMKTRYGVDPARLDRPPGDVRDEDAASRRVEELRRRLAELGDVNPRARREYERVKRRLDFLRGQATDLRRARGALETVIDRMDRRMRELFVETCERVDHELNRSFRELFGGGRARLRLASDEDPLEAAVELEAQPPGKKVRHLSLMSGGEVALTAAALLFALLKVRPAPFCVLDEVEAALDDANVTRFGRALGELASETQFIIITHQKGTMEVADLLHGITMGDDGVSRRVSIRLAERAG